MSDIDATLRWLDWWHSGFWRDAHPSWHQAVAIPAQATALARVHGAAFRRRLAVMDTVLPRPQPQLLILLTLDANARTRLLMLVAEICTGKTALPNELKIWCRRLAKGLRPESWLPTSTDDRTLAVTSLKLLQAHYPDYWPRLRMGFEHDDVVQCPPSPLSLDPRRLQALWEAALWQCQRPLTDEGEGQHSHVAT